MPANYVFPKLANKDILICLKELDISISMSDLKEPTVEIMAPVYSRLLEILVGINMSSLRQPNFTAMSQALKYPELHNESIYEMGFMKAVLKLLRTAGYPISIRDIMYPTAKQVKLILSAVINFAKFREERMAVYQEFTTRTEELLELKQQLEQRSEQLAPILNQLKEQREAEMPQITKLEQETQEAAGKIGELNKVFSALGKENRIIKNSLSEENDKISHNKLFLSNVQQKVDKLRAQVVRSPEKLRSALQKMDSNCEELTIEINDTRKQLRDLQTKHQSLTKLSNKLEKRTLESENCSEDVAKKKALLKETRDLSNTVTENEENAREAERVIDHLSNQISMGQERLFNLSRQFEHKRQAAAVALNEVNKQKNIIDREFAKDRSKIAQNEALIKGKLNQMEQMTMNHEMEMNKLREKYEEFGSQVHEYHEVLLSSFTN